MIRAATYADIPFITEIYNDAIANTTATFDSEIKSVEQMEIWFRNHDAQHPVIVSEENGTVNGWASLSKWSDRCAYDNTSEFSVYVHKDFRGKGIGTELMEEAMNLAEINKLHVILSRITQGNETSVHMHERFGFFHIGVMKEVGFKFGKYLDVYMMQKLVPSVK